MKTPLPEDEILRKIAEFARWHYQFDLKGHLTPIFDKGHIIRHRERRRYFFDPLIAFFGGSLKGKRVLDLGCNAGYWSLLALQAGCDFVLGLDARPMHIEQAEFVFRVHEVDEDRFSFRLANVFDPDGFPNTPFEIVLCLGLLYHVSRPLELIEKIAGVNTEVLLLDTNLSPGQGSFFSFRREAPDDPRNSADSGLVLVPTRQAVIDLVADFGYECYVLKPPFQADAGVRDYRRGYRRAFLCVKKSFLASLPSKNLPGKFFFLDERRGGIGRFSGSRWRDVLLAFTPPILKEHYKTISLVFSQRKRRP